MMKRYAVEAFPERYLQPLRVADPEEALLISGRNLQMLLLGQISPIQIPGIMFFQQPSLKLPIIEGGRQTLLKLEHLCSQLM